MDKKEYAIEGTVAYLNFLLDDYQESGYSDDDPEVVDINHAIKGLYGKDFQPAIKILETQLHIAVRDAEKEEICIEEIVGSRYFDLLATKTQWSSKFLSETIDALKA